MSRHASRGPGAFFWAMRLLCASLCAGQVGAADMASLDYQLQVRSVANGVGVIEGAVEDFRPENGCNIINTGLVQTPQGVWIINTGPSRRYGEQQRHAFAPMMQGQPLLGVVSLNLHPDYFFGNQAWHDAPLRALPGTIQGMRAEGEAYATNLYALCGDWMKGTESTPSERAAEAAQLQAMSSGLQWLHLKGHTADDLVLIDAQRGVVFAGGLVFVNRLPTTPHADLDAWLASLDVLEQRLQGLSLRALIPSHGPVRADTLGIAQTRGYLIWLRQRLRESAAQGLDLGEVLALPLPEAYRGWAAPDEYDRSVTQLYPQFERASLRPAR